MPNRIHPEMVQHLLLDCSFTTAMREETFASHGKIGIITLPAGRCINSCWEDTIGAIPKARRREASGEFIYAMWGVWKERNRRVFCNTAILPAAVSA